MPTRQETPRVRKKMFKWFEASGNYENGTTPLGSPQNDDMVYRKLRDEGLRLDGATEVLERSVRSKNRKEQHRLYREDIKFALDKLEDCRHKREALDKQENFAANKQESFARLFNP